MPKTRVQSSEDIAVPEALTLILDSRVSNYDTLNVTIEVVGQALDQFVIKGKNHPNGPLMTLASTTLNYTTLTGIGITEASGDLTLLAAGASGLFVMDVRGFYDIKIYAASGNVAGSTVSVFAGLK
jgi:hypothetical protein